MFSKLDKLNFSMDQIKLIILHLLIQILFSMTWDKSLLLELNEFQTARIYANAISSLAQTRKENRHLTKLNVVISSPRIRLMHQSPVLKLITKV